MLYHHQKMQGCVWTVTGGCGSLAPWNRSWDDGMEKCDITGDKTGVVDSVN